MLLSLALFNHKLLTYRYNYLQSHPIDVDKCDTANGGCQQLCNWNPTERNVTCGCSYGYKLNDDGRTCSKDDSVLRKKMQEDSFSCFFFRNMEKRKHGGGVE